MILNRPIWNTQVFGIPRESGDDPYGSGIRSWLYMYSPARAGMIRRRGAGRFRRWCIPRKSGGDLCGPERSNRTEKWMENWELIEVSPLGCDFGSMKHRPIST